MGSKQMPGQKHELLKRGLCAEVVWFGFSCSMFKREQMHMEFDINKRERGGREIDRQTQTDRQTDI